MSDLHAYRPEDLTLLIRGRTPWLAMPVFRNTATCGGSIHINSSTPHLFTLHPHLSDEVNHNIVQSEIDGGVYLKDLAPGSRLEVQTQHHWYTVVNCGDGWAFISGHPTYCPQPLLVRILGSNWGGAMLKTSFIGRSMHLEFKHPEYLTPIVTSRIRGIKETPHSTQSAALPVDLPASAN